MAMQCLRILYSSGFILLFSQYIALVVIENQILAGMSQSDIKSCVISHWNGKKGISVLTLTAIWHFA